VDFILSETKKWILDASIITMISMNDDIMNMKYHRMIYDADEVG